MSLSLFVSEGNIGSLEIKKVSVDGKDKSVVNLSVKFDIQKRGEDGYQDHGFWADVSYWGKRAETLYRLVGVGARILVVGDASMRTWDNPEEPGDVRQRMAITARFVGLGLLGIESIQFKTRGNQAALAESEQTNSSAEYFDDDIPH